MEKCKKYFLARSISRSWVYFSAILLTFSLSSSLYAKLRLNISIVSKKKIGTGPVLVNELHTIEEAEESETISIAMQSGIKLSIKASFIQDPEAYGPSARVRVKGKLLIPEKKQTYLLYRIQNLDMKIGEKKQKTFSQSASKTLELAFVPSIYY